MLRTRLWMGAVLILLVVGMLVFDRHFGTWYPFLFAFVLGLALAAGFELLHLLPPAQRPYPALTYALVVGLIVTNWIVHLPFLPPTVPPDPWRWLWFAFGAAVLVVFLVEMATFQEPGNSVMRMALTVWAVGYLAVLPSFFAQLRWLPAGVEQGTVALALAIFVPKGCDIGAYTAGRLFGRHRMTPVLSPKKTWEGAAGGLVLASAIAVGIDQLTAAPVLQRDWLREIGFGLSVGIAGMLGDLAESLIKRDCRQKDASQAVPGFGGVLDVVDSVVFAAPVVAWWLW
ncbi:MAG TPA: phosphatidate cytidylyltransferase [Gemmataceae bacterium]|nr:phosphatidate cytidylyltransferase [Gemmataceae bacterium]